MRTMHHSHSSNERHPSCSLIPIIGLTLLLLLSGCGNKTSPSSAPTPSPRSTTSTMKPLEPFTAIDMLDEQNGWALTSTSVLKTSDGGVHWKDVSPQTIHHIVALQGAFLNTTTAWITVVTNETDTIRIFRTIDGGNHWDIALTQIQEGVVIGRPDFINAQEGWLEIRTAGATGNEGVDIYRTIDEGNTWTKISSTNFQTDNAPGHIPWKGGKTGISFLNASTGWATGDTGGAPNIFWLYVTPDGGATWQHQNLVWPKGLVDPSAPISPPVFFGKNGLLPVQINDATHHNLDIYVTHDGGANWQSTTFTLFPGTSFSNTIAALDVNHIWVTDGQRLTVTNDGGQHWNQITPHGDFHNVSALDFISSRVGWAIGTLDTSLLLKTTDGGHTWAKIKYSIS